MPALLAASAVRTADRVALSRHGDVPSGYGERGRAMVRRRPDQQPGGWGILPRSGRPPATREKRGRAHVRAGLWLHCVPPVLERPRRGRRPPRRTPQMRAATLAQAKLIRPRGPARATSMLGAAGKPDNCPTSRPRSAFAEKPRLGRSHRRVDMLDARPRALQSRIGRNRKFASFEATSRLLRAHADRSRDEPHRHG